MTGETQFVGIMTVDGALTHDDTATEIMFVVGIETMTAVGTYDGTFSHEIITADGSDAIVMY